MLLDFDDILKKHNMKIKGVIHIGAHYGQEHLLYKKNGIKNIVYFEPLSKNFNVLKENVKDEAILYNLALGNKNEYVEMFVENENNGQSSSILQPKLHLTQYPHITFNSKETVKMDKLDNIKLELENYNFINIDVQGYELEVFKGAIETLNSIDYIISEINRDELYVNCTKFDALCEFLSNFGFEPIEQSWIGRTWGDGLFIKNKK